MGGKTIALIVVGALVAIIIMCVIAHKTCVNYRVKYGLNIYLGGTGMLISLLGIAGGIALLIAVKVYIFAVIALIVGALFFIWVSAVSIKHCGVGKGILAIVVQMVLCVPSVFLLVEMFRYGSNSVDRAVRRKKRKERRDFER